MFVEGLTGYNIKEILFKRSIVRKNHLTRCKEKTLTKIFSKAIITFVALG